MVLKLYSQSKVISNFTLCEKPLGVMWTDQGPVLFCIWFESSLSRGHRAASTFTWREETLLLSCFVFYEKKVSPNVLYNIAVLILPTCTVEGFPFMMLLNVMLTPAGTGLLSKISSVIGWSVGMAIVRGRDWLTPGLKRRENPWGWRNRALAFAVSVLQKFSSRPQEDQYLRSHCGLEEIITL